VCACVCVCVCVCVSVCQPVSQSGSVYLHLAPQLNGVVNHLDADQAVVAGGFVDVILDGREQFHYPALVWCPTIMVGGRRV
jgi:hypothetical protein